MNNFAVSLLEHLEMTFVGVLIGAIVGIALASVLKNRPKAAKGALVIIDIIQTVPTLAMLIFLMLVFGLNNTTVIVAIFLYSLFPIMRNTYVGLTNVDRSVIRAAKGIGMTRLQIYTKVELPIAMPVIFAGLRLAIISALGIATTGVFIGSGGLGMLIWRGIQTRNTSMMLSGAIAVSVMALLFDRLFTVAEKKLGAL